MVRTALRKARAEVRDVGIDLRSPTIAPLIEWEAFAPHPAADRLGIEALGGSNLAEGLPLGKAGLDLLVAVHPGSVAGLLLLLEPRGPPIPGQRPEGWRGGKGR